MKRTTCAGSGTQDTRGPRCSLPRYHRRDPQRRLGDESTAVTEGGRRSSFR